MSSKKWVFSQYDKQMARSLAEECGIEPLVALLLLSRGVDDPVIIDEIFSDEVYALDDPYWFADMDKAVKRINDAIENFECIAVYGDYDADGITSSAILYKYLMSRGAKVMNYIPDRLSEGYGMHISSVEKLSQMGVNLIITVDNGICCNEEIAYAKELGIDTVVTDHHLPGIGLPQAIAVIDPHRNDNYPEIYRSYAGVGVALKLICALEGDVSSEFVYEYCDLVAIGTVADIVPLTGENRTLVRLGLQKLNSRCDAGIAALVEVSGYTGKKLTSGVLSFVLAPRINASGRMGMCEKSFSLLMEEEQEKAIELAQEIERLNTMRKDIEAQIFESACNIIKNDPEIKNAPVIVVGDDSWHEGVLGIVASRLTKYFSKPSVVFSYDGQSARGSARSVGDFNIYNAVNAVHNTIDSFGGHKMALGISAKRNQIDDFRKALSSYCISVEMPALPELKIDCRLNPLGVSSDTANLITGFEPFGQENPVPIFALMNMQIEAIHPLSGGKHLSITFSRDGYAVRTVYFGVDIRKFSYCVGDTVDVAVNLECGVYKDKPSLSVLVKDIRPSKIDYDKYYNEVSLCAKYFSGVALNHKDNVNISPSREEVGLVYKYFLSRNEYEGDPDLLLLRTGISGYGKLIVSLKILDELGFITVNETGTQLNVKLTDCKEKRPIDGSRLYRAVHDM